MSTSHLNKIFRAHKDGTINDYMAGRLVEVVENGVSDDLSDELIQDARDASSLGVQDDKGYKVYFFVNNFADDILKDTFGISARPEQKTDLCSYVLSHKGEDFNLDSLTDYRIITHKWLCDGLNKKAYPNIAGKENRMPIDDIKKWVSTLKDIYGSLHNKKTTRSKVIDNLTANWDREEKQRFINWMRYYESGNTEKYNVKNAKLTKQADITSFPQSWMTSEDRASDGMYMTTYKADSAVDSGKTSREKELEKALLFKTKMRARLRSLKRLLDKFQDVLTKQNLDSVFDEMHALEKSIGRLDVYASMQDCVIRSANRLNKIGFVEGADFLKKIAEEDPAATPDVLPQPIPNTPNLQPDSKPAFTINTIIDRLEGISKLLKTRDTIRELASVDILLNELGMASYFPELTDSQSKLIEAFGYASNKIESIVAKLRGSGTSSSNAKSPQAPAPLSPQSVATPMPKPQPSIETGEAFNKPVGKVEPKLPIKPEQ